MVLCPMVLCPPMSGSEKRILRYRYTKRFTNDHDQRYDLAVIVAKPRKKTASNSQKLGLPAKNGHGVNGSDAATGNTNEKKRLDYTHPGAVPVRFWSDGCRGPVRGLPSYNDEALGLSDLSRSLHTAVLCSALNRTDKVRLRRSRSMNTRRGRHHKKMRDRTATPIGPDHSWIYLRKACKRCIPCLGDRPPLVDCMVSGNMASNGKYLCPKIYFNHRCFSGPYLNKGRIAELPKSVGPGNCVLVLKEVLSLVINAAYKPSRVLRELELQDEPLWPQRAEILKANSGAQSRALLCAIHSLRQCGVIVPVPEHEKFKGFYSNLFVVPKKDGKVRPILDLKLLNKCVKVRHFRMESLRFLRFAILEDHFQFTALPFGLATAPRVFTKVMAAVMAILHSRGVVVLPYLDDLLIKVRVGFRLGTEFPQRYKGKTYRATVELVRENIGPAHYYGKRRGKNLSNPTGILRSIEAALKKPTKRRKRRKQFFVHKKKRTSNSIENTPVGSPQGSGEEEEEEDDEDYSPSEESAQEPHEGSEISGKGSSSSASPTRSEQSLKCEKKRKPWMLESDNLSAK
ncbi:unnamed protein product, partial [Ranitomeya imitator]